MKEIKLGKYKHYKGNEYEVIGFAKHTETLEDLIIYKPLYKSKILEKNVTWARPKKIFLENVNINREEIPRFKYIKN